jgi:hypothetical protein
MQIIKETWQLRISLDTRDMLAATLASPTAILFLLREAHFSGSGC